MKSHYLASQDDIKVALEMWHAPEASDDEVTTILNREPKGHPIALRFFDCQKQNRRKNTSLLSDEKFALMNSVKDFRQLRKLVQKQANKLTKDEAVL